jgi:hypothetical protein
MDTRVHVATVRLPNASSKQLINRAVDQGGGIGRRVGERYVPCLRFTVVASVGIQEAIDVTAIRKGHRESD